ncbi:MAG TPA: NAD(P)-dependent oxidoreductase, partial [Bryobacteraceae bacterium]|nr:NAD(P)-dependent oxidoreductase [Bryobacteraceae bacterium]
MRLFVTGASGFIGAHFARHAVASGAEVIAVSREPRTDHPIPPGLTWLTRSLADIERRDLEGTDIVVHLAAAGVSPQPAAWDVCYKVNVLQSVRLASLAAEAGVRRIVATGSFAEYGRAATRYAEIPADCALEPTEPYSASKASFSIAFRALAEAMGLEAVYQRLFSVYGEGQFSGNFWPSLRRAAQSGGDFHMTPGEQIRDFVSVEAVCERLFNGCRRTDIQAGVPYFENVASGSPQSLRQFAEFWWDAWGARQPLKFDLPYRRHEVMRYVPQ